jgi:membrane glycosyltransferase
MDPQTMPADSAVVPSTLAPPARPAMALRRAGFAGLVFVTVAILTGWFLMLLAGDGIGVIDMAMAGLFAISVGWLAHGFWNTVIGVVLLHGTRERLSAVFPLAARTLPAGPLRSTTAIVIPVRNEDPQPVFARLSAMLASIDATGEGRRFRFHVLSDTDDATVAAAEERLFQQTKERDGAPGRLHYRRRPDNRDFKAGNIREFVESDGRRFDLMIVLDADSLMSGDAMVRLVRLMEADPRLGIVQSLIVGLPADRPFSRIFQFGMRLGMRPHTVGAAWWQGDCGPYWGHNAIIRVEPFRTHCRLPRLSGKGPLAGTILSHDQVEAVLMRRAGYHVRALPVADGSYEENPPTLPDFMKRDLRWCHGNMQYVALIGRAGLHAMGRIQLLLAILMYASAPVWLALLVLGVVPLMLGDMMAPVDAAAASVPATVRFGSGAALFATVILMSVGQRWLGVLDVALRPSERRQYGGLGRLLAGATVETAFGILLAPVLAVAHTVFIGGLPFGRTLTWSPQRRSGHAVGFGEALSFLWPQTALGGAFLLLLATTAPGVLPWAAPLLAGLLLSVPFAVLSADAGLARRLHVGGVCAIPEETAPPDVVRRLADQGLAVPVVAVSMPEAAVLPEDANDAAEAA